MTQRLDAKMFKGTVNVTLLNKDGTQLDSFEIRRGTNLWVFIRKRGHPIGSACSGVGVCGACNVTITQTQEGAVSEKSDFEKSTLARNSKNQDQRLACLCRVFGDVTVEADYW